MSRTLCSCFLALAAACWPPLNTWAASAQPQLTVQADKPGAAISPTLFGVFFEDINFAGDGGLYPELVKNRSFEFTDPMAGWSPLTPTPPGASSIQDRDGLNAANPHYLRVKAGVAGAVTGLINEGFRGMGVRQDASYTASLWGRAVEGGAMTVGYEVLSAQGRVIGEVKLAGFGKEWKKQGAVLHVSATEARAKLRLSVQGQGTLDLDMVSLYPQEVWGRRPNGLRSDLVQLLKDMQPGFVRFPGGCIVEGRDLENRYQWKTTVGDVSERRLILNRWNNEFKHRPAPDYFQSFGLGFFEYFQLCEDIGAQPLPILNCGMACQFNTGQLVPLDRLDPYIQDALDLIEFANGPADSPWGKRRSALGHPAPFGLKLLGVGNEQWGPQYVERYEQFAQMLKRKYPGVSLIASAGPSPGDDRYRFLWNNWRRLGADIVDEHCYDKPEWFFQGATRYDHFPRGGPKIFMGEYAAQSVGTCSPENRNNWECALAEAAFMTGFERNADLVVMSSYAPLSGHVDGWQWRPNLIWFDNLRSVGTVNYQVQKLFSVNRGTHVLPVAWEGLEAGGPARLFASAALDRRSGEVILKVVNGRPERREITINLGGLDLTKPQARLAVLASDDLQAENTLDHPDRIVPVESRLTVATPRFTWTLAPNSLGVLRISGAAR
jgi:alpha-L-arabinofuranosidase